MNDIKVCLETNWWQLWLHWRQWHISRVPGVVHWRGSLWFTVYETIHWEKSWLQSSKVHQRWRQEAIHYTVLEAPSCQMNRNWPYRYRNCPYRYRNCLYRYTDYSTPFAVNPSLSESMQSPKHIECSSVFPSQETGTNTFSSSQAKFQQLFTWSISLARVAFSLVNLRNVFQLITSVVNTDASTWLLPSEFFHTYWQT